MNSYLQSLFRRKVKDDDLSKAFNEERREYIEDPDTPVMTRDADSLVNPFEYYPSHDSGERNWKKGTDMTLKDAYNLFGDIITGRRGEDESLIHDPAPEEGGLRHMRSTYSGRKVIDPTRDPITQETPVMMQGVPYQEGKQTVSDIFVRPEVLDEEEEELVGLVNNLPKESPKDPRQAMLDEYRALMEQRKEDIAEGRKADADSKLYDNLNKAFAQANQALSSGYAGIKVKPIELGKTEFGKQAERDTQAELDALMKEYKLMSGEEGLTPYQKRNLEIQKRRLDLMEGKEGRLSKKDEFQKEVKSRLSDKEVEGISAFEDGERILGEIDSILKTTDVKKDLGPYASRVENLSNYIPGMEMDEDFVKMQQLVGIQLADYVKSISGAQVSEQEAQRLLKNIPNVQDKPKAFKTKLNTFKKELKDARTNYLENIGKQKKGAEKFLKDTEQKEQKAPYGDEVKRNGKVYKWNPMAKRYQLK